MNDSRKTLGLARDERRESRFPVFTRIRLYRGMADGGFTPVEAAGVNISEGGAAVVVDCELPFNSQIYLELPNSRMSASGRVRSCIPVNAGWRIGISFDAGMIKVA